MDEKSKKSLQLLVGALLVGFVLGAVTILFVWAVVT